jgi:hypothetical protein
MQMRLGHLGRLILKELKSLNLLLRISNDTLKTANIKAINPTHPLSGCLQLSPIESTVANISSAPLKSSVHVNVPLYKLEIDMKSTL